MNLVMGVIVIHDIFKNDRISRQPIGNYLTQETSMQPMPSSPFVFIDKHEKESYDGLNEKNGQYQTIEHILESFSGFDELKGFLKGTRSSVIQICKRHVANLNTTILNKLKQYRKL